MKSVAEALLKRIFTGNNYYALGKKIITSDGKDEVMYNPVMEPPTERLIEKHLAGEIIIGGYTLRQDNTVMWLCFDVDSKEPESARDLTHKISVMLGEMPHVVEYSGRKGYHIWIFFKKAVEADRVRAIAAEIRDASGGKISGETHVEIFPKQDELTVNNPLGNLVKLPLGVHPISGARSKFIYPLGHWEEGTAIDPGDVLELTTDLESLASCLEGYEDPIEVVVKTLSPHWVDGERHDMALFLSGWLATSGWDREDTMTVIERLQQVGGGDLNNQLQCVNNTYDKFESGGQILGIQALAERIPGTVLRRLAEAISRQNVTPVMILIDRIRNSKGVPYLKSRAAATAIMAFLQEKGKVLIDQNTEKLFWLDKTSHHLYNMEDSWWDTILYNTFGLNTTDSFGNSTSKGIFHTAREMASKVQTFARSNWDGENLWINLGGSYNYVLTGEESNDPSRRWGEKVLNGENNVIFRTQESGLHLDLDQAWERGVRQENPWNYLVNDLNFGFGSSGTSPDQQKELIKAWFLSTFFPNIMPTRPLLVIIADPGAGKTTAARRFLFVLEGPTSDVSGLLVDKPDSLRASLGFKKFIVLDNLEKIKAHWVVDILNRASTGTHIELRKLHTTNDVYRIIPDVFFILTATSLPFAEESLFTRMLPVELAAIKNPTPEYIMQKKITENLEGIWMGVFHLLNSTVRELKRVRQASAPSDIRLADFSMFCSRLQGLTNGEEGVLNGKELMRGLGMMTNRQKTLLHESSPFIVVLDMWLREDRERKNGEALRWHSASDLNAILSKIAKNANNQWIWESGHSLSKHIQALEDNLKRSFGMETQMATNNSPKKFRFKVDLINFDTQEIPDNVPKNVGEENGEVNFKRSGGT